MSEHAYDLGVNGLRKGVLLHQALKTTLPVGAALNDNSTMDKTETPIGA